MDKECKSLEKEIAEIKRELAALGRMRPGSLSRQSRARGGGYFQLSYSHSGKGHTEYVRPDYVDAIRKELEVYGRFRELTRRWIALELELSKRKQLLASQLSEEG